MRIGEYQALRRQLSQMEQDPALADELKALEAIEAKAHEIGFTNEEAARMLNPARFQSGERQRQPVLAMRRKPKGLEQQFLYYDELKEALAQIQVMMRRIEKDPGFVHRRALTKVAEAHGFTPAEASLMLVPAPPSSDNAPVSERPTGGGNTARRRIRYWRNPNTGQIIQGRNVNLRELTQWKREHGDHVLTSWEISEAEAKEHSPQ